MLCTSAWHHRRMYQLKLVIHARKPHGYWLTGHIFDVLNDENYI